MMPTVTKCDLFAVELPFKVAFRHAAAARISSESLFLRLRLDNGMEGWGEALPRAYVLASEVECDASTKTRATGRRGSRRHGS